MNKPSDRSRSSPRDGRSTKEKLVEITEKLEKGVSEVFTSENYTRWLKAMSKFHHYSFNNTLLIMLQAPYASSVASYDTWKKLHRQVRKGEKGIKILVPAPVRVKEERQKTDPLTMKPLFDADGNPVTEETEHLLQHYRIGHVFAYEQTDGEPLPELGPDELTGKAENFELMKAAIISIAPVSIRFDEIEGDAKGYYSSADKEIVVKKDMSEAQTMKTMIHELAHSLCHDRDRMAKEDVKKDRQTKEVEAESVAFTVCQFFGLDTSDYSFPYVTGWSSGRDLKELRSSMDFVRETSKNIIDAVAEKLEKHEQVVSQPSVLETLEKQKALTVSSALTAKDMARGTINRPVKKSRGSEAVAL